VEHAIASILQHLKPCWSHAFSTVRISSHALNENIYPH